jgi:hypothetical protein
MSLGAAVRAAIWVIVAVTAWFMPRAGEPLVKRFRQAAGTIARKRVWCCVAAGLLVLVMRIVLLPIWDMPSPYIYDEFGYILQADTFASGRVTNPPHPQSDFFESIYILQHPSYTAKFPPGQGLMLAAGQAISGYPWIGVWLSCGLLAAVMCWALQQWFPPGWALFGTAIAIPMCLSSYWMDSYWGGAVTATGGALVIGALPSIGNRRRSAWIFAAGCILLIYTRPFEGSLFLAPLVVVLFLKRLTMRDWAAIVLVGLLGAGWLGYYNYRVTGSPTRLPYVEYDRQYPSTPHVNVLPLPPPAHFSPINLTWMDQWEREAWQKARSSGFVPDRLKDVYEIFDRFAGSSVLLLPLILSVVPVFRKLRILLWPLLFCLSAALIEVKYYDHYAAPFLVVVLILLVESFRHLRAFKIGGRPAGRLLFWAMPALMLLFYAGHEGIRLVRHVPIRQRLPANSWRGELEESLAARGGGHLVFVRYTKFRIPHEEWIYNRADIDNQVVIWAQDLGLERNRKLIDYYKGRTFWLFQPDENPNKADPYRDAK